MHAVMKGEKMRRCERGERTSRHLSDKDGFDGFTAAGTVADGRPPTNPSHREEPVSRIETETDI